MKRIEELNQALESTTLKWNLLNAQLKKSRDDVRYADIQQHDNPSVALTHVEIEQDSGNWRHWKGRKLMLKIASMN